MAKIHHTAIISRDVDASLRFWRDGLGFGVLMDFPFDGDWPALFGAESTTLRSVFLGDPADADAGVIELVVFGDEPAASGDNDEVATAPPASGFFLVSLHADIDAVLPRLAQLGVVGEPRVVEVAAGVRLAVVTDPDGVKVELMDRAEANLGRIVDTEA